MAIMHRIFIYLSLQKIAPAVAANLDETPVA